MMNPSPTKTRFARRLEKLNTRVLLFARKFNKNLVATYWYDRIVNFGDLLSPVLLRQYGLVPFRAHLKRDAMLMCVGSVLDDVPEDFRGYILGSGLLHDVERRFPKANILAVRGDLTRQRIAAPQSTVLGDPGLLADSLLPARQRKQYQVGIVPHYIDKQDPRLTILQNRLKNDLYVIDVQRDPVTVIADIDRCDSILSSSLHGLIAADALGIPNSWLVLSGKLLGNDYKFQDYASAFGETLTSCSVSGDESLEDLIGLTHPVSSEIIQVKGRIRSSFMQLKTKLTE